MSAPTSLKDRASTIPWWLLLLEGLVALVFAAFLIGGLGAVYLALSVRKEQVASEA